MPEAIDRFQKTATTKRKHTIGLIADAARKLLDERGWHGVTREDIAKEAGVSVSTLRQNLGTKQNAALVAYAPLLRTLVADVVATDRKVEEVITDFIHDLVNIAARHPAMVVALLMAHHDTRPDIAMPDASEVPVVDFEQLAECFGLLLEVFWGGRRQVAGDTTEIAEFYLFGLLSWMLKHPNQRNRAAAILISQL